MLCFGAETLSSLLRSSDRQIPKELIRSQAEIGSTTTTMPSHCTTCAVSSSPLPLFNTYIGSM